MNRNLIRFCGTVISILMSVGTRIADAAETCNKFPVENQSGLAFYQKGTCTNRFSGYIMKDKRMEGVWKSCATGDYAVPYSADGCSGGYCTPTGLFCFTADLFISQGCRPTSGMGELCMYSAASVEITYEQEFFYSCSYNAYQTTSSVPSHTNPSNGSNFSSYCQPCSGLKFENNELVTYPSTGTANNNTQFSWGGAGNKIGIESCKAYPMVQKYTNNKGTFSLPTEGCTYKS